MDMLTLSHVSKSFGSKKIIDDLSFTVPEHCVYGFIGQNGAGKTTTMKMILGLLQTDSGTIKVNGETVRYGQNRTNRYMGYLPDVPEFYGYMTPSEYLRLCGEITGMSSAGIRKKSDELLHLVGLDKENKRIHGFSRGMKQRLGIAQALLNEPKLLICDEPTSAWTPLAEKRSWIFFCPSKTIPRLSSPHISSRMWNASVMRSLFSTTAAPRLRGLWRK